MEDKIMTAKEWHYSRYAKGMNDDNGVLDAQWNDMKLYKDYCLNESNKELERRRLIILETKEASRKLYDKNEELKNDNKELNRKLDEKTKGCENGFELIKELRNRIHELDLLGTISINENKKLLQQIYDMQVIKIKAQKLKVADLRELEKQVSAGEISYGRMVELINERFGL